MKVGCRSDPECSSKNAYINNKWVNPCAVAELCGKNAECTIFDKTPFKTMICECPSGYKGNAVVSCTLSKYNYRCNTLKNE